MYIKKDFSLRLPILSCIPISFTIFSIHNYRPLFNIDLVFEVIRKFLQINPNNARSCHKNIVSTTIILICTNVFESKCCAYLIGNNVYKKTPPPNQV